MKNCFIVLVFILLNSSAISAELTVSDINKAKVELLKCEEKSKAKNSRGECANKAFNNLYLGDHVQVPNECAKRSDKDGEFKVNLIKNCKEWLESIPVFINPIVVAPSAEAPPVNPVAQESSEKKPTNDVPENKEVKKEPITQETSFLNTLNDQTKLIFLAGIIISLLIGLVLGYFLSNKKSRNLQESLEKHKSGIELPRQELKTTVNDNSPVQVQPESQSEVPPINAPLELVRHNKLTKNPNQNPNPNPYPNTEPQVVTPVAPISKPPPSISGVALQQEILLAISSLANARTNLTEANFVFKLLSVISDQVIKSSILEKIESVHFFRASGNPSPQGPELIAFALKGNTHFSVVPYPSAGRVGQFSRWFDNAGSGYADNPVLANKPALGSIGQDGNLVLVTLGTLT